MMKNTTPIEMSDAELVAWLAGSGLDASVVERCPHDGCELCGTPPLIQAA